jgi:CxxC-x17-CxxC domain-containing protein
MIVFRCGADDADFLEKEFDPEFTPQDVVNLPNFKIYLKLMIDGITSRPFSAKTLAPLVKGGNMEIEKEVIETSRKLYCKPKEDVEREINNWSGMSLGDENLTEKFPAICSMCAQKTNVPFKPEAGRSVYCKDCISKIKSGEMRPIKGSFKEIKQDEVKYFKPLSDLGIEFENKNNSPEKTNIQNNKTFENINKKDNFITQNKKNVFSKIKKVFNKQNNDFNLNQRKKIINNNFNNKKNKTIGENTALKEILNKTLNQEKIFEEKKEEVIIPEKQAISLNDLNKNVSSPVFKKIPDRAASPEDMNKLKNLILNKEKVNSNNDQILKEENKETEQLKEKIEKQQPNISTSPSGTIREVPEDVLRKILEE